MPVAVGYDDTHGSEVGRSIAFALLQAEPHLTGLVALNDMYAIGACAAVRELGMTVPRTYRSPASTISCLRVSSMPPLTTVHHPIEALSVAAVERLVARLQGKADEPPQHLVLAPEIVVRRSTGRPKERKSLRSS